MASEDISMISSTSCVFPNPDSIKFKAENYHHQFTSRLVSYREREKFTDVVVKCKHLELSCHKVVLAAASSYFHQIFDVSNKEANLGVVELTTFSPDVLSIVIDFIYTAEVTLNTGNVKAICSACDELGLSELKEGCDSFISQRVEPYNCLGLYVFSKSHNLRLTLKAARQCMYKRLVDILRLALDQEYRAMDETHVIEYISSDDLEVEDEGVVFQFVQKWVSVDPRGRENSVDLLLEHVRLAFCEPAHLCGVIEKSNIMQSKKCLQLLNEAKTYQLVPEQRLEMASPRTMPRNLFKVLLIDASNEAKGKCWYLEGRKREWNEFTTLPVSTLRYFAACMSGKDIVVTGGLSDKNQVTNQSWALSLTDRKWQVLPSMNEPRRKQATVSVAGEVYVLGGNVKNEFSDILSAVEKLDSKRQGWTQLAPMTKKLKFHKAVGINENIYVMGGVNASGSSLTLQKYNIHGEQWELKANMPQPCRLGSAVYLNAKIYMVGDKSRCCMSYDPGQDAWTVHTQPLQEREAPAAAVWKGKIVLCGGDRNDVEEYDVDTDKWTEWNEPLPASLIWHSMLTANQQ